MKNKIIALDYQDYKTRKILIVDDDQNDLVIMKSVLNKHNYNNIFTAKHIKDALEMIDKEQPDLVMTDFRMGNGGGKTILDYMAKNYSDKPTIVVSGSTWHQDVITSLQHRAWDYIPKTMGFDLLDERIVNAFQRSDETKALTLDKQKAEEALKSSDVKYRQLFTHAPAGIYEVNFITQKFTSVNDAICEYLGHTREELLLMSAVDLMTEGSQRVFNERMSKFFSGEKISENVELKLRKKNGEELWVLLNSKFLYEDGKPKGASVVVHDITKRKQADAALKASEVKFRRLVENSIQGMVLAQNDPLRISYASQPMAAITGYTPKEIENFSPEQLVSLIHPEDRAIFFKNFQDRLAGKGVSPSMEHRLIHKDGSTRWVNLYSIKSEHEGNAATQTIFIDITAEKKALESLKASEVRFRELADSLPQPVFEIDADGKPLYFNKIGFETFGYPKEKVYKQLIATDFLIPEDKYRILENMRKDLSGIDTREQEYTAIRKDSSTFPVAIKVTQINKNGKSVGLRGIIFDLSERKLTEKLIQRTEKAESISTMTGGIAHDFNNILSSILANAEIALMDLEEGLPLEPRLKAIFNAAINASAIVKNLVTYTKPSDLQNVNINQIIQDVLNIIPKQIKLNLLIKELFRQDLITIKADANPLRQVFMNIIINAAHAMQDKQDQTLTITTDMVDLTAQDLVLNPDNSPGKYILCKIADTGIGISKELIDRIFDPYFTTKELAGGTGLVWIVLKES